MMSRIAVLVLCFLMVLTAFGTVFTNDPMVASGEAGDEIGWQYGEAGIGGSGDNQLQDPGAADYLDNGNFLIMDVGNVRAIEVDNAGNIVWQYGTTGVGGTGFNQLGATAWMAQRQSDGNTLLTDTQNHRVIEVDSSGNIVWQYGVTGSTSVLYYPRDAERLSNGNTIIADTDHNRIVEVDSSKNVVWSYSCSGVALPSDVDRLSNDNTLICEPDNYRVIEVNSSGSIVWQYGTTGVGGYGSNQVGLLWDADRLPNGNTLITDTQYHRVIEVTPLKQIVWQYGVNATHGTGPNYLHYPWEADRLPDGTTLITEKDNHRVIQVSSGDENVTLLFQDGFGGDLSNWDLYGTPRPYIDNGAIKGNGDGFYGSDAVTKASFDRTLGDISIQARIKISQTLRPGWFGYGDITSGNPDVDPSETVYYGFRFQGTLYDENLTFTYWKPGAEAGQSSIPWTEYDQWHVFKVVVKRGGGADFYVDGSLRFSVPELEHESGLSNESVIVGSHDPPYWFDNIVVKRRSLPPPPPMRWGLVLTTSALVYDPGDKVDVYAHVRSLATLLPVEGEMVSFQVDMPDGAPLVVSSEQTSLLGWANITFTLPVDAQFGPYTVYATSDLAEANKTFRVGHLPLFIVSVSLLGSYLPGDLMDITVLVGSAQAEIVSLTLVLQVLDSEGVPLPPSIDAVDMSSYAIETTRISISLPSDALTGTYSLQAQLMTALPRDHGTLLMSTHPTSMSAEGECFEGMARCWTAPYPP